MSKEMVERLRILPKLDRDAMRRRLVRLFDLADGKPPKEEEPLLPQISKEQIDRELAGMDPRKIAAIECSFVRAFKRARDNHKAAGKQAKQIWRQATKKKGGRHG